MMKMGGRASRQKGYRAEANLVKELTKLGFDAKRVPCSGAVKGFKGDIYVDVNGRNVALEVKCRRNEFKSIYALYEGCGAVYSSALYNYEGVGILVSYDFNRCGFTAPIDATTVKPLSLDYIKAVKKLAGLIRHVKDCDMLVIKIDYKPYLYVRYLI